MTMSDGMFAVFMDGSGKIHSTERVYSLEEGLSVIGNCVTGLVIEVVSGSVKVIS